MSRIRQIKPSWFLDKELRRGTTADAREFYIGLWMLADDDGWMEWDVERIGAELYPYDGVAKRERNVTRWAESLRRLNDTAAHLIVYLCGHAVVPKMPAHQRIAGTRSTKVHDKHLGNCRQIRSQSEPQMATERGEPVVASRSPGIGIGKEGTVGSAAMREGAPRSEFQERVPRAIALALKDVS